MSKEKQDAKVRKAINDHQYWLSQWVRESGFSVEMISPRGKRMTHSGYCFEVNKHMAGTIKKIRNALGVQEQPQ